MFKKSLLAATLFSLLALTLGAKSQTNAQLKSEIASLMTEVSALLLRLWASLTLPHQEASRFFSALSCYASQPSSSSILEFSFTVSNGVHGEDGALVIEEIESFGWMHFLDN
jgi:hypothetical protein